MASARFSAGRIAWLCCVALLVAAVNAAVLGAAFLPNPAPTATNPQEWIARLLQSAAGRPLPFGLLLGVPAALVLIGLLPLARVPGAPLAGEAARAAAPLQAGVQPAPKPVPVAGDPTEALRLLAMLQREGRFIDFLQEDIAVYEDAQIGAAVREIHDACRKAVAERLDLEPVLAGDEGASVTVEAGFDPGAIRVTGNVSGSPPFHGVLRHGGWRAAKVVWPPPAKGRDLSILAPAEVEIP